MNSTWVSDCITTNTNKFFLIDIVVLFFSCFDGFCYGILYIPKGKGKIPSLMMYNSCKIFVKARYEQHTFMIVII
jgi:hypothetical protein